MSEKLYSPKDAAAELDIASSTLRLWAARFSTLLSNHANPPKRPGEKPGRRLYTKADLQLLKRAKQLLRDGLRFAEVFHRLEAEPMPPDETLPAVTDEPGALITSELVQAFQVIADQKQRLDALEQRISELEKKRRPWYRRLLE